MERLQRLSACLLAIDPKATLDVSAAAGDGREEAYEIQSITVHGQTLAGGFGLVTSTTDVRRIAELCRHVASSSAHAPSQ